MTTDIDTLEQIAKAATPGPWHHRRDGRDELNNRNDIVEAETLIRCKWTGDLIPTLVSYGMPVGNNAVFIATFSPERVLALLAVVRAARELDALIESGVGPVSRESASLHCALAAFDALEKKNG